jgi:hypothetical protein
MKKSCTRTIALAIAVLASFHQTGFTEAVKDREGAVRQDKATMENDDRWIYNDVEKGFAEAKKSGKPLLVALRCVPCLSCAGLDASVLQDPSLTPLLDKFVCVRIINANALDLAKFQFDYDLSFSTLFFNGDGTIYGRFGSWKHQKDAQNKELNGYKSALSGALDLHKSYPANKAALAGKQGVPTPFATPVEIPALAGKYQRDLDWQGKVVQSCVHCHQIGDAFRESFRRQKKPIPDQWIYPMPSPEVLGLELTTDQAATVGAVTAGSPAAKVGLKPGDKIHSLNDQPLLSPADFSWVLHGLTDNATLPCVVVRGTEKKALTLSLPAGWRHRSDISKRVGTWQMRGMATGGLVLEDLDDAARQQRKLGTGGMALLVKHVGQYGNHAAAKHAGFQKEDVIVELDSTSSRITEGELIGALLQKHLPGDNIAAVVLRGQQKITLSLPMQ